MAAALKNAEKSPFEAYASYVSGLERLAREPRNIGDWDAKAIAALDGQASVELRRVVPVEERRKFGAFFTGTDLSSLLLSKCSGWDKSSFFYDPSCGMGDLLLGIAKKLPLENTPQETLKAWGRQLGGTDQQTEFIAGAKKRLKLLALKRHGPHSNLRHPHPDFFPHIRVADGLKRRAVVKQATHLLLNPPFGQVAAPSNCSWAGGRITEAAIFVVKVLEKANAGTEVLAILPDVLRSGSFTKHWRNRIAELAKIHLVQPYGIFDESADVDVFLLRLIRREKEEKEARFDWPDNAIKSTTTTISDHFDVHVGRVVPHRDKKAGPRHPYIHPRCVPIWTEMRTFSETRKHEGLVYQPPFVVIRRTSRPGHPYRAAATIIAGKTPVAVENHLVVCEPKDGKLKTCRVLMQHLKTKTVNNFLDARIRCRHLTVASVKQIPFSLLPDRKITHE